MHRWARSELLEANFAQLKRKCEAQVHWFSRHVAPVMNMLTRTSAARGCNYYHKSTKATYDGSHGAIECGLHAQPKFSLKP